MKRRSRGDEAFSLVEVALALGIAAFCLVTVFGLLPVGIKTSQTAVDQSDANRIISAVAADLRATPPGEATTSQYAISIPGTGVSGSATLYFDADGALTTASQFGALYRLTLTFPSTAGGRSATLADLKMSWPPAAVPSSSASFVETLIAIDRN